ncbi:MAG: peptide chain release factor N(5)-glutamine methyltransferase [Chloroflexi bacterium]|nr:peptide chain release factor N(5)-glutamine methyltransferase [Chloroflexota bacterium]
MTLRSAITAAAAQFRAAGIDTPRLDAEMLLCSVLGSDRLALLRDCDDPLSPSQELQFGDLVSRRTAREPLPYLLGRHPFLDFFLFTAPGVLIPRPETELLVETGAQFLSGRETIRPRAVDVGAGTGAIPIGLARRLPAAEIAATDISPAALAVARRNVESLGVKDRVRLLEGSLMDPIPALWRGELDLMISNPPYIPSALIESLQPEVARYEPREALDGGNDGLAVIRELAAAAPGWLRPTGALMLEVGESQARAVLELFARAGLTDCHSVDDLAGIPRVVVGRKSAAIGRN